MACEDEKVGDARIHSELAQRGFDPDAVFCRRILEEIHRTAFGTLMRFHRSGGLFALARHLGVQNLPEPVPEWYDDARLVLGAAVVYAAPVWLRDRAPCWSPDRNHMSLLWFFLAYVIRNDFKNLYLEHCRRHHSARLQIYICLGRCSLGPEVHTVGRQWAHGHPLSRIADELNWSSELVRSRWDRLKQHLEQQHDITIEENL